MYNSLSIVDRLFTYDSSIAKVPTCILVRQITTLGKVGKGHAASFCCPTCTWSTYEVRIEFFDHLPRAKLNILNAYGIFTVLVQRVICECNHDYRLRFSIASITEGDPNICPSLRKGFALGVSIGYEVGG